MHTQLTDEQRKTLEDYDALIKELFAASGENLMTSFHAGWNDISITYFTPNRVQHSSLWTANGDNTFAGKIQRALDLRAEEDANADKIKAERIEQLRGELATLTGEAA